MGATSEAAPITTTIMPSLSVTKPTNASFPSSSPSSSSIDADTKPSTFKHSKPHPLASQKETNQAAVRAARAEIRSKLREDWEFPVPASVPLAFAIDSESIRWVERDSDEEAAAKTNVGVEEDVDPPQWDNPDPFGAGENKKLREKRKRREKVREEMEWNVGLRHWSERRDAWTAARVVPPFATSDSLGTSGHSSVEMAPPGVENIALPNAPVQGDFLAAPPLSTASRSGSSGTTASDATTPDPVDQTSNPQSQTPLTSSSETLASASKPHILPLTTDLTLLPAEIALPSSPTSDTSPSQTSPANHASPPPSPTSIPATTLIPIPPPLLPPSNPIRASITTQTYPPLYTKLVLQSQRPTIPIPLSHLIPMMVGGWKRDGEWPPKATVVESVQLGKAKGKGWHDKGEGVWSYGGSGGGLGGMGRGRVRRSVGKVKRVLGIGHEEEEEGVDVGVEGEGIVES